MAKYTIRAPFGGVVTASEINPGTLVRQGQKLGEFASTDVYEMEAFADLEEIRLLRAGMPVSLTCDDLPGDFEGTVSRINEVIDQHTQLVGVYITTTDTRLRDGLYMTASIQSDPIAAAARVPRSALVGNGHMWIVQDSVLTLREIDVAAFEDGQIVVRGLLDGAILVVEPPEEAKEGMRLPATPQAKEGAGAPQGERGRS